MRALSASELLEVWERGSRENAVDRALTLLAASSDETRQELAALSIGWRDARLLEMYEALFGSTVDCFAQCPKCAERLEYAVSIGELIQPAAENKIPLVLDAEEARLLLRLPNSGDLRAAGECLDAETAHKMLLQRCVMEASRDGTRVEIPALAKSTAEKIARLLAEADPQAETLIDLTCCACQCCWQVILDIECLLWGKINALAKRLLREVHTLAFAYGWREHDILGLSSVRRQAYLEMAGAWPTF
jgi:hypothetical protein